jgi:uncharacterized HAD superfamily protein
MVILKPNVGVDIDGVVADFNKEFLRISRKLLGKPEKGFKVTNFHYHKCGWTEAEANRVIKWMRHTPDFWTTLEPLDKISKLRKYENKLNLFYITARFSTDGLPTNYQTEQWLRERLGLSEPYAIVSEKKGDEAVALDLDYYLDDRDINCVDVADKLPSCKTYILTQPWNEKFTDKRIKRVASVNEFIEDILKNEKI